MFGEHARGCLASIFLGEQARSGLAGIHIMKRFDICDYKIVMIGLLSMTMKMMCTGSATRNFVMYLSIVFGCLSNIGLSSLRAIVANLGSADETGRLVSTISIVMGWSPLVSSVVFNNVYRATLDFYTGTTFIIISALLVLCLVTVLFLYYDSEHQMKKKLKKVKTEEVAAVWHIQSITSRRESVIYS
uniref:Uncharacterized protein n=1 Tax=Romanomermis culicivorax TaxID=13658 RepID=A0A915IXE3_ROMCU